MANKCLGLAALLVAGLMSGCTYSDSLRLDDVHSVWDPTDASAAHAEVFFATDRQPDGSRFGYGLHWDSLPHCGIAQLSIPAASSNDRADIEGLQSLTCGKTAGMMDLAQAIANRAHAVGCGSVLVVVHGYNTVFRSALLRAAQLSTDTQWRCPTLVFSWSSEGKFDRYVADVERSGYSVPILLEMLRALHAAGLRVEFFAESMGARIALSAAGAFCDERPVPFSDEMILAAPDVGVERGNDDFGHLLKKSASCIRRVTLYASDNDMALMASESLHGGIPRAGRLPKQALQYTQAEYGNVEVVDAGLAPGDSLGHSYFALSYELMADAGGVLAGLPAASRATADMRGGPTLICMDRHGASCSGGRYLLAVSKDREPGWSSRLLRHVWPVFLPVQ